MKTGQYDTTWARAWLPPLMTGMVDTQFADPPGDRADPSLAAWPRSNPYRIAPEPVIGAACAAPSAPTALVRLLRRCLAGHRVSRQHSI